jgi:hypothetical protein
MLRSHPIDAYVSYSKSVAGSYFSGKSWSKSQAQSSKAGLPHKITAINESLHRVKVFLGVEYDYLCDKYEPCKGR